MKPRFTLRQLEYLVAVAETGSIALAAERINVSSPSISAAISQLEAELGIQLFIRNHSRGMAMTSGGRQIFDAARQIISEAGQLHSLAAGISERPAGPLAIGCLTTLAPYMLAMLWRGFSETWPDVRMTTRSADQRQLLELLDQGVIDLAITYDLDIPPEMRFVGIASLPPCVLVGTAHPLAGEQAVSLAQLAPLPMVLLDLPHSREYFLSMFHVLGLKPLITARSPDPAVLRSLVANGFGYGLLNIRPVVDHAADGRPTHLLDLQGSHRPMMLGVAMRQTAHQTHNTTAFIEYLGHQASKGQLPGLGSGATA